MTNLASTVRFLPPGGKARTIVANGRFYTVAANGTIDVPPFDAIILAANGWVQVAGSGTSAQRPTGPFFGQRYHDTTLGCLIFFEGSSWRNPDTGAVV